MTETFKKLPETCYSVSDQGQVRNDKSGLLRKFGDNGRGYLFVPLSIIKGNPQNFYIHRLIAEAFVPNPDNLPCVNHINGIKSDNRSINLEWCSYKENTQHSKNVLKNMIGEKNGSAKLTEEDVLKIRELKKSGVKQIRLAEQFNVSTSHISILVGASKRKIWTHI